MLGKAEAKNGKLEKKESLATVEVRVNKQISVAENILIKGTMYLSKATAARNILEIEDASPFIERANAKLTPVKDVLGKKRKALLQTVIPSKNKIMALAA